MFMVFPSRFIWTREIIGKSGENPALSRNCKNQYATGSKQYAILPTAYCKLPTEQARRPAVSKI